MGPGVRRDDGKYQTAYALSQADRQPAQIRIRHQAELMPCQFERDAPGVGEQDAAHAAADHDAGAARRIGARDIRRPPDVADAAAQHRARSTEHETIIDAANRERITATMEIQYAAAAVAADDPSGLDDRELHIAFIGACGRREPNESNKHEDDRANSGCQSHWFPPDLRLKTIESFGGGSVAD